MVEKIEIQPVTVDRWDDLEALFGANGAYSNCWCMFWRVKRKEFDQLHREGRKAKLHEMTRKNEIPGILAYVAGQPAGWCSVGPRESFLALESSRILKRVDDQPVWSIVCFFVGKGFRGQGMMSALVHGAVAYARSRGARIVEGYPIDLESPKLAGRKLTGCSGYMGIAAAFRQAGFVEVGRASETQLIMRHVEK
jgi:GNAT superfamily N-acetyltransferase